MATNVYANRPNVVIAKNTKSFADLGFNILNVEIIYLVGDVLLSWRPNRPINGILGVSQGQGYYIVPKVDMDLEIDFAPPLTTGGGGSAPVVDAGASQSDLPAETTSVQLSGSATPVAAPIQSYLWVYVSFPEGRERPQFADRNSAVTEMSGLFPGTYVMQLQAQDTQGNIGVDTVVISINQPDVVFVNAGVDQILDEGTTKTNLYGSAVPSGDAVIVGYEWSVVTPGLPGVTFTDPTNPITAVNGLPPSATTVLRLTVTDNLGYLYTDDISLTVQTPSEMYYEKNGVQNQWNPDDLELLGYVYLPQGYNPANPPYDAYLFLGGIGSNLDQQDPGVTIEAMLDLEVGLPELLWNKKIVLNSVVFMAQRRTGYWDGADTQKALTFMSTNFNINANKTYITGYSSGGRGSMELPSQNPGAFAAAIPAAAVAAATDPNILKNIPLYFVHGYGDSGFAPLFAPNAPADQIDDINAASPKGKYPPLALFTWSDGHNPRLWTDHLYDIRIAGWNFDKWAKMHAKNDLETHTNYVVLAEQKKLFIEWAQALILVTRNLPDNAQKTALLARLNAVKATQRENGQRLWMVNFGASHTFNMYTVTTLPATAGTTVQNIPETDGTASTINVQNASAATVTLQSDGMDNYYMGMGPDMYKEGYRIDSTSLPVVKIQNLLSNKLYDIQIYYSNRSKDYYADDTNVNRKRTGFRSNANGDTLQSWQDGYNSTLTLNHTNIRADINGEITISFTPQFAHYGVVMAMLVREKPETMGWLKQAKFNFTKTVPNDLLDWNHVTANPSLGGITVTDSTTNWQLTVGGPNTDYWQLVGGQWAGDTEANAGSFPAIIPSVVGQSAFFTQGSFNAGTGLGVASKPNLVITIPQLGLQAGDYEVIMYSNTKNVTTPNAIDSTYVSADFGGTEKRRFITPIQNNYVNLVNFKGTVREGGSIIMNIGRGQYGYTYINALIIRQLRSKQI